MKNSMSAWPDIVFIDGTYMLLKTRLTVMLLVVEDGNGLTEVVGVGLLANENRPTFEWFLRTFKDANTEACSRIRSIMGDKDLLERDVLKEVFSGVPVYICRFHTLRTFKRAISTEIAGTKKVECLKLLERMVYSSSEDEYDKLYTQFREIAPDQVLNYFVKNWHEIREDWTAYSMTDGNLKNMTNKRLESMNGKIKQVVQKNSSLVEFINKFFGWLRSHNFEANAKLAKAFLKVPVEPYSAETDEYKFKRYLMPFVFPTVLGELEKVKYIQINECIDETEKKCIIKSNRANLEASDRVCHCEVWTSSLLPCRHIFAVRKHFGMPLFAEELCNQRWTRQYVMENHRSFNQSGLQIQKTVDSPVPSVHTVISKKPVSVQDKRRKITPFAKQLIDLASNACGPRFDNRMDILKTICHSWSEGHEVKILKLNDLTEFEPNEEVNVG
ncbi:uncharacterized protein [Venturia canescens]|uniref:uncharacterized protein n=1 Tax=Venturia canescens TaxID=32260 RepID=UPI001C9BEFBD|nr:uncharacterized protein LOC122406335 [Venturia canescens]